MAHTRCTHTHTRTHSLSMPPVPSAAGSIPGQCHPSLEATSPGHAAPWTNGRQQQGQEDRDSPKQLLAPPAPFLLPAPPWALPYLWPQRLGTAWHRLIIKAKGCRKRNPSSPGVSTQVQSQQREGGPHASPPHPVLACWGWGSWSNAIAQGPPPTFRAPEPRQQHPGVGRAHADEQQLRVVLVFARGGPNPVPSRVPRTPGHPAASLPRHPGKTVPKLGAASAGSPEGGSPACRRRVFSKGTSSLQRLFQPPPRIPLETQTWLPRAPLQLGDSPRPRYRSRQTEQRPSAGELGAGTRQQGAEHRPWGP